MKEKKSLLFKKGSVEYLTDGRFIYANSCGTEIRLDIFDRHYYKLRPFNGIPVLEIDGLRMQLVRDFKDPLEYSRKVVADLGVGKKSGQSVLDTCMGLGYTAIEAAKKAESVVTCELSEAVFALAKWNPFSDALFEEGGNILPMKGDVSEIILQFQSSMFDFIIHDPPRISHAPGLYSSEFYKELFRVSKNRARIFHYVGSTGARKGRNIAEEVKKRLSACGFSKIEYDKKLQGLIFEKI